MILLAIETATEACSVGILRQDGKRFTRFEIAPRAHMQHVPTMLEELLIESKLDKSEITHCAISAGPGAFTGIRIGASIAQGIALGLNIPLLPVSTLAVLAQTCLNQSSQDKVMVALDARMDEIYWAVYERDELGLARLIGQEHLSHVDTIKVSPEITLGFGQGWATRLGQSIQQRLLKGDFIVDDKGLPDADSLLQLGESAVLMNLESSPESIKINYLRNRVAHQKST